MSKRMLLHICCAPCSTYVIEVLKSDYELTGFFYNPNIHPKSEYLLRKKEMKRYADVINLDLVCAEYDPERWFEITKGMDNLPEGDKRCSVCYEMRLEKCAFYAKEYDYDIIATTLSISPHKNAEKINEVGLKVVNNELQFYEADFKKKGGFERSIRMSKQSGLYRQSYCGCVFSKKESDKRKK
jgi:predicted adenine nucleotide alpha hydrolase (AANH) superfamily ATPase